MVSKIRIAASGFAPECTVVVENEPAVEQVKQLAQWPSVFLSGNKAVLVLYPTY